MMSRNLNPQHIEVEGALTEAYKTTLLSTPVSHELASKATQATN